VGPLLLLHFLVSVVFVMQIVPRGATIARSPLARLVGRVGKHSLECFCISTVLVYAASAWMSKTGNIGAPAILIAGAQIMALVCLWAILVNWIKSQPWRKPPAAAAKPAATQEWSSSMEPVVTEK
jgi:hypothetical protein